MSSSYFSPGKVCAPKKHWRLESVIWDSSIDSKHGGWSLASGTWQSNPEQTAKRRLAIRWNGDDDVPNGSPKSRARPTWFVLPLELTSGILFALLTNPNVPIENIKEASQYIELAEE